MAGATILELGCGAGADSAEMLAGGFDVYPTDGSPEMAGEARTLAAPNPEIRPIFQYLRTQHQTEHGALGPLEPVIPVNLSQ